MWKNDADQREGNDRFEGYLIDLITEIAKKRNFKFELYVSPDGNYGSKNNDGIWNGMIRELIVGVSAFLPCSFPSLLSLFIPVILHPFPSPALPTSNHIELHSKNKESVAVLIGLSWLYGKTGAVPCFGIDFHLILTTTYTMECGKGVVTHGYPVGLNLFVGRYQ